MTPNTTLHIITWKWNDPDYTVKYTAEHVNVMTSMLSRHLKSPHRHICITDDPVGIECETFPLWGDLSDMKNESWYDSPTDHHKVYPSCYRRLKLFSSETTKQLGIESGERVISIDLDVVITDTLDSLFALNDNFIGWYAGEGHGRKSRVRNFGLSGSIWMFRAGTCDFLWDEFDSKDAPQKIREESFYGSDQGWISYNMFRNGNHWTIADGIRRYSVQLRPFSPTLPNGTKIAVFNGKWKPWYEEVRRESPWIAEYYR